MERKVRVRFAPSPTGPLHIGGVRTALYNYLFARQHGGDFVFRIEDTDSQLFVPGAEDYIIESFRWLGIKFDEGVGIGGEHGPYRQSERREIYKKYVQMLLDNGKAYIAFDTPEELDARRQDTPNFQYDAHTRLSMRNSLTMTKEEAAQVSIDMFNKTLDKNSKIKTFRSKHVHIKRSHPGVVHYDGDPIMADSDLDIFVRERGIRVVVNPDADKRRRCPTKMQTAFSEFMSAIHDVRIDALNVMKETGEAVAADFNAQKRKVQHISRQLQEKLNI